MNTEFSQEFKDFLNDYPAIGEKGHYACWISYQAGKLKGQIEATEQRIKQLEIETQQLRDSINSTNLNLPSKQDALPDNLLGCDGRKFRCKIYNHECDGAVSVVDERVYLCQNYTGLHDFIPFSGGRSSDKNGYKYSWFVGKGTSDELNEEQVTEFELID